MKKTNITVLAIFIILILSGAYKVPIANAQIYMAYAMGGMSANYQIDDLVRETSVNTTNMAALWYTYGDTLNYTAYPPAGYAFSYWSDGTINLYSNPQLIYSSLYGAGIILTAHFSPTSATTYTINATDDSYCSITPSGSVTVTEGTTQSFAWQLDDPSYHISQVEVDGNIFVNVNSPYIFTNVTADHNISIHTASNSIPYYQYTFYGPYYDDGTLSNETVTTTVYWLNRYIYTFSLTGPEASTTLNSATPVSSIIWNASSALNYTRLFTFQPQSTDVRLFIPDPNKPSYPYTFPVIAFIGISNAYLQTRVTISGGTTYAVEQVNLNSTSQPSFIMQQYQTYTLTLICDQGVYSQQFIAENIFSNNIILQSGTFQTNTSATPTATASRTNSTTIHITYSDPNATTTWVYVQVSHMSGSTFIIDSIDNQTTSSYDATVAVGNTTDYYVQVQAYREGTIIEWNLVCPIITGTNPFAGLLDFLGTWPVGLDPAQLFGAGIIMCCLGLGSFRSAGVSCLLAWIVTGILVVIGWFTIGIPMFMFAGALSVFVVLDEAKAQAREA